MVAVSLPSSTAVRERFRTEGPQVLRIVVAAALSWQICVWLGAGQPPVFAVVVPLVALRDHPYSAVNLSIDRMMGVIAGVLLAELSVRMFGISLLTVTGVLLIGLTVGVVLRIGPALNVQIAISAMLVFASADPGTYAFARIWETAVGAVVCVVLSPLLLPPDARKTFERELGSVTSALVEQLHALGTLVADAAEHGIDRGTLDELSERSVRTEEAARALPAALAAAERAVRLNPLRRRDVPRLAARAGTVPLTAELARLERLLLDEVLDLSSRPDLLGVWPDFRAPLLRVLEPAEAAVAARLEPSGADTELVRLLAGGDAEILRWRGLDARPIAAVMRRPLRRLFDVLAGRVAADPEHPGHP